ncbi:hypothetical protein OTU49_016670 [Cherax quadricarinatus]|uniref:Uncharacterized protein n=1 Tax=Cherax quadricarinatus TaxID=27406 RepID=A0AAW0YDB1_CHEQU
MFVQYSILDNWIMYNTPKNHAKEIIHGEINNQSTKTLFTSAKTLAKATLRYILFYTHFTRADFSEMYHLFYIMHTVYKKLKNRRLKLYTVYVHDTGCHKIPMMFLELNFN